MTSLGERGDSWRYREKERRKQPHQGHRKNLDILSKETNLQSLLRLLQMVNQPSPGVGEFTYSDDGLFRLKSGVQITDTQAKKIFGNRKPTLVVKGTAHAIWGINVLAGRSVSGELPPTKRGSGEAPKPPLTPDKIGIIEDTLRCWGTLKK